jgi:hypothetical protein
MRRGFDVSSSVVVLAFALGLAGCAATVQPAGGGLTASQQLIASEAIDRALDELRWPNVDGHKVFIEIGATAGEEEQRYLRSALAARVAERGGKVVTDLKTADSELVVLAKAMGIDATQTFFGLPTLQSSLVPVGLPEIPLYKATQQKGVAKLETVLVDRKRGGVYAHPEPVKSEIWVKDWTVLFFSTRDANTHVLDSSS